MDKKKSSTWDKIMGQSESEPIDDALILKQLGVDSKMLVDLQESAVESAKEKLKVKVNFLNKSSNPDPSYKYVDDSGFDLRANLEEDVVLKPLERQLIPTGIHFELPESYEIQVRPRSGLAVKNGISVVNTPGTVDRGYSGEIKIILINLSNENFTVKNGDRVAQAVVSPVISGRWAKLTKLNNLDKTLRGDGGFGSTGVK
jgi:dUTP pyrophosphatase|tara:strand:+ start:96 stop:698 length:603 start_codon:yes stop_codon:yes gene_type:complete